MARHEIGSAVPITNTSRTCDLAASGNVPIAIVGADTHQGSRPSKQAYWQQTALPTVAEKLPLNWWGVEESDWFRGGLGAGKSHNATAFERENSEIKEVRLPIGKFRIPPLEMQDMLPQQQLMLKVADGAIRDSAAQVQHSHPGTAGVTGSDRTGVFIGIELDPNTTNFHFRWAIEQDASHWAQMLGLDLSPDELAEWIQNLKDAAGPPLTPNRVMGNLGGIVASRLAREFDVGGPSFTISCGGDSGCIAFELASQFLERGELDAALVGAVDFASDVRTVLRGSHQTGDSQPRPTLQNGSIAEELTGKSARPPTQPPSTSPDGAIGFLLRRRADAVRLGDRIYAATSTGDEIQQQATNESITRTNSFVYDRATLTLESILQATFAAYRRHDGNSPLLRNREKFRNSFELSVCSDAERRHRVRLEPDDQPLTPLIAVERFGRLGDGQTGLIVISANTRSEFAAALAELERIETSFNSVDDLARHWYRERSYSISHQFLAAIVAADRDTLAAAIRELKSWDGSRTGVSSTGSRSVFVTSVNGQSQGQLAFVFPGSGSGFPGMGRELLSAFPEVLDRQDRENMFLERQYRPRQIWSREGFAELLLDHKTMIFTQVAMGTAICDLLALFGVHPAASIGYSLGESSALFGLRAWIDRDEMLMRMEQSPLFGSDLVAPFDAARKAWNVPIGESVPWVSGVIDRSAVDVRRGIERICSEEPDASVKSPLRLYLLIINTPRQCVIGGDRVLVAQLIRDLNGTFVPLASPSTVHCSVLREVEPAYRELHLMRTTAPVAGNHAHESGRGVPPIRFYSTGWGRSYNLNRESAADAIVAQAVDTIDFPRVIEQAYADGVRLFVEIGPGSSCTKMIDEILGDRPHQARAALPVTSRPIEAFYELLAALIVERVPVALSYLYGKRSFEESTEKPEPQGREVVTRVGGRPVQIPAPPCGWRFNLVSTGDNVEKLELAPAAALSIFWR